MKRIITTGICALVIVVFFTGCSSLNGSKTDLEEIVSSAAADASETTDENGEDWLLEEILSSAAVDAREATDENGENRLGITSEEKKIENYFQRNMAEKFKDLGGEPAFAIKEGHSKESSDIEGFEIGAFKSDKTFVYGYATRVEEEKRPRKIVHCGAFYNYESKKFQVFHENIYARSWEDSKENSKGENEGDEEAFFLQVCDNGTIFVYDNGDAFFYDSNGKRIMKRDIEGFVRRQFANAYSISIVHAATDGKDRIYLEVSIEKEKIEIEEEKKPANQTDEDNYDKNVDEEISEEDMDKEADELDKQAEEKVETRILVYELKKVNTNMNQHNTAFEKQKNAWIEMTEGQKYEIEEAPNQWEDWSKAVNSYPDFWGDVFLDNVQNITSYQWKGEESFFYEDDITTLVPSENSYQEFRDLKKFWQLENIFILPEKKYSLLFGKTGDFTSYNPQTIERTYTLVWTETTEIPGSTITVNGTTITLPPETVEEEQSKEITQTLNIDVSRYTPLQDGYMESYWIMDKDKAVSLGSCIGNEILCTGEDKKVRWIQPDGSLKDTSYMIGDETEAGAFLEDGTVYYVEYGKGFMSIVKDMAHGGTFSDRAERIVYEKLEGGYQSGDSAYDAIFEKEMSEQVPVAGDIYSNDFFEEEDVLHAAVELDRELGKKLYEKGDTGICRLALTPHNEGLLLSSESKGLIFYEPVLKTSAVLENGTWFRTWKSENKYISIGFPKGESSYSGNDIVHARVYEYDLTELCNQSMESTWEDILSKEEKESKKAEEESLKAAKESEEGKETQKNPMERWNEEYKESYKETYPTESQDIPISGEPERLEESAS